MKDIQMLIKLTRKLGQGICDTGTFDEQRSKYLIMKWQYKGTAFAHKFPGSHKSTTLNYQYSQMRKNLRASGLKPPDEKSAMGSDEKQLLAELWAHVGTDDEGETPYGGDVI